VSVYTCLCLCVQMCVCRQNYLPSAAVRVGENHVLPSTTVHDLRILIDSDVAMQSHVSCTVSGCFAVLRQLRSIRRSVSDSVFHLVVVLLVMLHVNYGNATLAGLPASQLRRFQSVMINLLSMSRSHGCCETFTGCGLRCMDFKLAVLVYQCMHGLAQPYLSE